MFRQNKAARVLSPAIALALLVPAIHAPLALAQEDAADLEEIIVTGSRGRPRTVSDSPVPVDVFGAEDIEAISYTDTNDIIKTLVPSFNIARQPISDGATFIRPAELRGLPTDKTLVLVNSKRRHRAALVAIGGSGTQGPDMATIPAVAIQNIEVLRDGAAAQYGSDAIAGVINFLLKDNREGGSVTIDGGQYHEGDGRSTTVQGNIGLPLGDNGFISISGEFHESDQTTRAEQYCGSWFCLDPSNPTYNSFNNTASFFTGAFAKDNPVNTSNIDGLEQTRLDYGLDQTFLGNINLANIGDGDVVQPWGQPDADAARVFFNAGIELNDSNELYGFGNLSESSSNGSFFYRYPYNGTIEELREPDGSIYFPLEKHPGGFTPRFFGEVFDISLTGGIRGEMDNGLTYDFSARNGESEIQYTLSNTINPSMGPDSPISFRPGDLINSETQLQADFTYELDNGALLAFGASWMDESYEVVEGEFDSYNAGPYSLQDPHGFCSDDVAIVTRSKDDRLNPSPTGNTPTAAGMEVIANGSSLDCSNRWDPVYTVVGVGSNGFPGYSPEFSDVYARNSAAVYGDISGDVTDNLFLQGAVRYEDYDDFDAELVWKLAGKLDVTDTFGIRASIGTAFRAPTPGQQGTTNVSTRLPQGFPVATGLFPAGGPIAQALGAVPLKPELSDNYTIGFTAEVSNIDLTVDFYRIDVQDRTQAVSTRDVSTDPTSGSAYENYLALSNAGVVGAESIGGVFYFANGFNTSTQGLDVVATTPIEWGDMGTTTLTASFNFTENKFDTDPSDYLNAENQFDFENFDPNWRGVITARHELNQLTLIGRVSYYGESINSNASSTLRDVSKITSFQTFDPVWYTDIEAQFRFNDMFRLSFGGRNILDEYPARDSIGDYCCGRLYSSGTGMDWQGAYYYGRLSVDF